jgi:TRAP-type mannitol/chloroaromatic compound transport system permease small subunit
MTASLCSSVLPGLGQVYNGETAKGYAFLLLTLTGLVFFLLPGLLLWIYATYDAWAVAGRMNAGETEFREARAVPLVTFVVVALLVIMVVLILAIVVLVAAMMAALGPLATGPAGMPPDTFYRIFLT